MAKNREADKNRDKENNREEISDEIDKTRDQMAKNRQKGEKILHIENWRK